jgi:hypothetical protein
MNKLKCQRTKGQKRIMMKGTVMLGDRNEEKSGGHWFSV